MNIWKIGELDSLRLQPSNSKAIQKSNLSGLILFATFILSSTFANSQQIENYSTVFDVRDSSFTRISYDNDLFVGTDIYYTQGVGIDVFSPKLGKNPLNRILVHLKDSDRNKYSFQFRTHGCSPTTILSDSVLIGDRPYSGVVSIGSLRTSEQTNRELRLTSKFEIGIIGPAALGKQTQTTVHKITGDDLPLGWQHQIKNAPIVNYTLRIEKGIPLTIPSVFNSTVFGQAKAGTFQSNISTGINFSLGRRNLPFSETNYRFECYIYGESSASFIGYDASLQGGIINRDGYHLRYSEIEPFILKQQVGFVIAVPHFSLGFNWAFISREIKDGMNHSWGGFRLTFY